MWAHCAQQRQPRGINLYKCSIHKCQKKLRQPGELKSYSSYVKKHQEQGGHFKKHSRGQVGLLPRDGNKRHRKWAFWHKPSSVQVKSVHQLCSINSKMFGLLGRGGWLGSKMGQNKVRRMERISNPRFWLCFPEWLHRKTEGDQQKERFLLLWQAFKKKYIKDHMINVRHGQYMCFNNDDVAPY